MNIEDRYKNLDRNDLIWLLSIQHFKAMMYSAESTKPMFYRTLLLWSEWGESPQLLFDSQEFKQLDYTRDEFIDELKKSTITSDLRRFTVIDNNLKVGDIIEFKDPTSWMAPMNYDTLNYMAEGIKRPIFLTLKGPKHGVYNNQNKYATEEEYILPPIKLKIINEQNNYYDVVMV